MRIGGWGRMRRGRIEGRAHDGFQSQIAPIVPVWLHTIVPYALDNYAYIHTYHSRIILEGVAELSQIFLLDTHVLPKLISCDGKPIAVLLQSISGVY
jgi:hypothetical protein